MAERGAIDNIKSFYSEMFHSYEESLGATHKASVKNKSPLGKDSNSISQNIILPQTSKNQDQGAIHKQSHLNYVFQIIQTWAREFPHEYIVGLIFFLIFMLIINCFILWHLVLAIEKNNLIFKKLLQN